jgi:hypothetical protein
MRGIGFSIPGFLFVQPSTMKRQGSYGRIKTEAFHLSGGYMRRTFWLLMATAIFMGMQISASAAAPGWTAVLPGIADSAAVEGGGIAVASGNTVSLLLDGMVMWTWKAAQEVRRVATGPDGSVVAAFGTSIVKLSPAGDPLWEAATFDLAYSLIVLEDGMILVGYEYGLLAFAPEGGKYLWEHYAHEECDT